MTKKASTNKVNGRTRNWGFILYPESAPENYIDILNETNVKYAISPLHDSDKNPDGETKKPHWHCVLVFDGVKSFEQVKEITDKLCAPIPQKINSLVGSVRYFTHKDNPEKAQYKTEDIRTGNGFDLSEVLAKTASEKSAIIDEIVQYIIDEDIIEFFDLVVYSKSSQPDWFDILKSGHTIFFTAFIKSNRHSPARQKIRDEKKQEQAEQFYNSITIDKETGEILTDDPDLNDKDDKDNKDKGEMLPKI